MLVNIIRGTVAVVLVASAVVAIRRINTHYKELRAQAKAEDAAMEELVASSEELLRKCAQTAETLRTKETALQSHMRGVESRIVGDEWLNGNGGWIIPRHNLDIPEGTWVLRTGGMSALLIRNKLSITLAYEMEGAVKVISNDNNVRNQYVTQGYDQTLATLKRRMANMA